MNSQLEIEKKYNCLYVNRTNVMQLQLLLVIVKQFINGLGPLYYFH